MKRFSLFIREDIEDDKAIPLKSEDKGRLFEYESARRLLRSKNREKTTPGTFREKASAAVKGIADKVGQYHHEVIKSHARDTAKAVHTYLQDKGHIGGGRSISKIYWTSNPDDPKKLAKKYGIKNPDKTKADVSIVTHEHSDQFADKNRKAVAKVTDHQGKNPSLVNISFKYGSQGKVNLQNSGLKSLEAQSGHHGLYQKFAADHDARVKSLGYNGVNSKKSKNSNRGMWEADNASNDPVRQAKAKKASDSADSVLKNIASAHRTALGHKSSDELEQHIRNIAAPKTEYPEIIVHGHVSDKKTKTVRVKKGGKVSALSVPQVTPKVYDAQDHVNNHLAKFEKGSLHVAQEHQGSTVVIKGRVNQPGHKMHGKISNVFSQNLKRGGTGPFSGFASTAQLG